MTPDSKSAQCTTAVVLVFESSLNFGASWPKVLSSYIGPILVRMTDGSSPLRIGIVVYGTEDTYPSPIICKNFFDEQHTVARALKDKPQELGVGSTNSGGSDGMSALEGLVAALEMFETLDALGSSEVPRPSRKSYILHVSLSPPNSATSPEWNTSPSLDDVSWDNLPERLKQKNIHYNLVNLDPKTTKFLELREMSCEEPPLPLWFPVNPVHRILLSGIIMPKGTLKRPIEIDDMPSPEFKRLRPSTVDIATNLSFAGASPETQLRAQQTVQRRLAYRARSELLQLELAKAKQSGNISRENMVVAEMAKLQALIQRETAGVSAGYHSQDSDFQKQTMGIAKLNPTHTAHPPQPFKFSSLSPPNDDRRLKTSPSSSTEESNILVSQTSQVSTIGAVDQPQNSTKPYNAILPSVTNNGSTGRGNAHVRIWSGGLILDVITPQGKQTVQLAVAAMATPTMTSHYAHTWPRKMNVTMTSTGAPFAFPEIQTYMERTRPIVSALFPLQEIANRGMNTKAYHNMSATLSLGGSYLTASWKLINGQEGIGAVILPGPSNTLVGTFFPINGAPELPRQVSNNFNGGTPSNPIPNNNPLARFLTAGPNGYQLDPLKIQQFLSAIPPQQRPAMQQQLQAWIQEQTQRNLMNSMSIPRPQLQNNLQTPGTGGFQGIPNQKVNMPAGSYTNGGIQ